jgi:hypothetical protein
MVPGFDVKGSSKEFLGLGKGTLTEKGRLSTVDLLNKVACFSKK